MTPELDALAGERTDDSLIGAERSTVGAMLLDGRVVPQVKAVVRPTDFMDWRYELIAETCFELHQKGRPVDVITVGTRMRVTGRLKGDFSEVLLHQLTSEVPTAANAAYYADIVAGGAARRRLRSAGMKLIEAADDASVNMVAAIEDGRVLLDDAIPGKLDMQTVGHATDAFVSDLQEATPHARTPWPDLDALITGWKPGRLVVIGARPAVGKTLVGVQIAAVMAQYGSVVYFSGEMDEKELLSRLYASIGGIRVNGLERHSLSPEEWQRFEQTRPIIDKLQLYVDDESRSWDHIEQASWDAHRRGNLKMIVVDYLGLYKDGSGKHESRQAELEAMTRRAKLLAKRLGITVVLLAQLNRDGAKMGGERPPTIETLRGSGSLEQDADLVILLHQPQSRNGVTKQYESKGELQLIVAKQRNGPTGSVDLIFEGAYARANHKSHW